MKKTILIPIAASIMCLGALALVPTKIVKVSAANNTFRFFLLDENQEFGVALGTTTLNINNTTTVVEKSSLSNPIFVEPITQATFRISIFDENGTQFYAKEGDSVSYWHSNIEQASTWTRTTVDEEANKYKIDLSDNSKHLGFKNKLVAGQWQRYFGTTETNKSDYNYNLILLSVEDEVAPFVTAISNIDCSTYNPSSSDWKNAKDAFDALPVPVKNYLQTLKCNPDASHSTIEWALSKYDYIVFRHHERLTPFITDRAIKDPTSGNVINYSSNVIESNGLTAIITVVSLITIASVTSLLFFKRKSK